MKKVRCMLAAGVLLGTLAVSTHARLVSVSGDPSILITGPTSFSVGAAPAIIAAPAFVLDNTVANISMQGFDEAQGVTTTVAHAVDSGGFIPAGWIVDSHMIFLNPAGPMVILHPNVVWTYSGVIIGVMSDTGGVLEANSTFELGNPHTRYGEDSIGGPGAPYLARGLELSGSPGVTVLFDLYSVNGNQLTVSMGVLEAGDWMRVVTLHAVPEPDTYAMMAVGLGIMGFLARSRTRLRDAAAV